MDSEYIPHSPVAQETMKALLAATNELAAVKPWEYIHAGHRVGLIDPKTDEKLLACFLGHVGDLKAVLIYRRNGLHHALSRPSETDLRVGLDCLKVELGLDLYANDYHLSLVQHIKSDVSPAKGWGWSRLQSFHPGMPSWLIDQTEAEQLQTLLPQLTGFAALFRQSVELKNTMESAENDYIAFLPKYIGSWPLQFEDLEWKKLECPPEIDTPYMPTEEQITQLRALKREKSAIYAYGNCLPKDKYIFFENGRPRYNRLHILHDCQQPILRAFCMTRDTEVFSDNTARGIIKAFLYREEYPETLVVDDRRYEIILATLCDALNIKLILAEKMEWLKETMDFVEEKHL